MNNIKSAGDAILLVNFEFDPFLEAVTTQLKGSPRRVTRLQHEEKMRWHLTSYRQRHVVPPNVNITGSISHLGFDELLSSDRVFLKPLSRRELWAYMAWLRQFVANYLDSFDERVIIFFGSTPHFPWDQLLAAEADKRGHKIISFEATHLPNRIVAKEGINYSQPDFRETSSLLGPIAHLSENSMRLSASKRKNVQMQTKIRPQNATKALRNFIKVWRQHRKPGQRVNYLDIYSPAEYLQLMVLSTIKSARSRQMLRRIARPVPSAPYVYCALHSQPERSTDPEAGLATFQEVFIRSLRDLLDAAGLEQWPIVVREHPVQHPRTYPDVSMINHARREWYGTIFEANRVLFAGPDVSADALIRGCRLAATINGSTAWEAALNGKPAVSGRRTWYSECSSTPPLFQIGAEELRALVELSSTEVRTAAEEFVKKSQIFFPGVLADAHRDSIDRAVLAQMTSSAMLAVGERSET